MTDLERLQAEVAALSARVTALEQARLSPEQVIDSLDSSAILARIAKLDQESRALRVLLRAVRARDRRSPAQDKAPRV